MLKRRLMVVVAITGFMINFLSIVFPVNSAEDILCNEDDFTVNTALGCVSVSSTSSFYEWLASWIFGVAGGVSFLLMVYGFIKMSTSAGDPKAVQGARETITSAISGLLLSVFGLFILRLIAIDVLHIPGLSR